MQLKKGQRWDIEKNFIIQILDPTTAYCVVVQSNERAFHLGDKGHWGIALSDGLAGDPDILYLEGQDAE